MPRPTTLVPSAAMLVPTAETLVPPPKASSSCVTDRTVPYYYGAAPGVTQPLAFGPPVEPAGHPLSVDVIKGVLIQRLCGGPVTPGGPVLGPDPKLFAALDAVVNGRDPNRRLTRAEWAAGVNRFITRNGQFVRAEVVSRTAPRGTATFGMRVRRGADPLVTRTRLAHADTSRYLSLPVHSDAGPVVVLTLRLPCGFQPIF
ncbi:MAG TPA: hypothetical protein VEL73_01550 [Mycobacteriales bacterium]|nr:hypothetical protein [Mycobacteriales bacterium]